MATIFIRLYCYIYVNQQYNVRWNNNFSHPFLVSNGVKQGAIISPAMFLCLIDTLIMRLRRSGLGCHISNIFVGCFIYADDIFLLSGSRNGLQSMVNICEKWATDHNMRFNTNKDVTKAKTKCIVFATKSRKDFLVPVILNGDSLPWVDNVKHLGNFLERNNSMNLDCRMKRA